MLRMKELYEKVAADKALQEKFAEIMKESEAAGKEETEAKLSAFAKDAGYDVTLEEMQTFFKELAENENGNNVLTDVELDQVAGGKSMGFISVSIVTMGIFCGLASYYGKEVNTSCQEYMDPIL